ncbi:hypothetical protein CCHL11_05798 [Colletotrichum chlorophyti]|uniref:Uncharacterized protein n=1 Tax=Colletotrichum chlorophyti TaxID=708187 RepID=A0A1Q8RML4_9PEZI|nr:hypothetical protein CCHL11_05798 [Colletotrichum chlorophyti]
MYIVDHFLNKKFRDSNYSTPDQANASGTNSLESIDKQVHLCRETWRKAPNVILVNFSSFSETEVDVSDRSHFWMWVVLTEDAEHLDWINVGQAIKAQNLYNNA